MAVPPGYCTREDVKLAFDTVVGSRYDTQIDREIQSASRSIDKRMRRVFYPTLDTRPFDWLDHQYSISWRLWLNENELAGPPTLVTTPGLDITAGVLARPDQGPPYTRLEIDLSGDGAFQATSTYQRAIEVTGPFGFDLNETDGGALASAIGDTAGKTVTLTSGAAVGVGALIRVDTERMIVTGKSYIDSTQTIQGDLQAQPNTNSVPVTDGSKFSPNEPLLVDSEKMWITDVAGDNLIVTRAWDGTPIAPHTTGAAVYAQHQATVTRGALGTTAATHSLNAPVNVHVYPGPISTLAVADTLVRLGLERTGYALAINRGEMTKIGVGIDDLWKQALDGYQRKIRTRTPSRFI